MRKHTRCPSTSLLVSQFMVGVEASVGEGHRMCGIRKLSALFAGLFLMLSHCQCWPMTPH